MKKLSRQPFLIVLTIVIIVAVIGGLVWVVQWAAFARPPLPEALEFMKDDELLTISQDPWLTFTPKLKQPTTGFIFYPGGRIDPKGYSPLMNKIATEGYLVVVPSMPINMAVFNPNIADDIIAHYPDIDRWVIAGHSIGGTMAAQYTGSHPIKIDGLMIWASYPAENSDLTGLEIPIITIYGSLDPRVNESSIAERTHLFPNDAAFIRIEGGDHHQFGSYEITPEENHAEVSRTSQHEQIIQETLELLSSISKNKTNK